MSENVKKIRTDLNDGTGNYYLDIYIDGELESKVLCNSKDQSLEVLSYGDPTLKTTYVYDEQGREVECKQWNIYDNGYEEFLLQAFTKYDSQGRVIEAMHEDIEEVYEHLFFTYSEVNGKAVQHVFDEEHNPVPPDEVSMLNWALVQDVPYPELMPILSTVISFKEAAQRIDVSFRRPESDNLIEINTPSGSCQVSVDDWNDKVLVVTYLFSDERDINSLPAYLLKTEEGGLYRLRYISSIEMDKMFSQMKDMLQLEDTSKVGYVVWY